MLQETVKVHWVKLYILLLLLFVWGALLPAYACPPEVDNAVARLQKSAKAKISTEDWLVQVVDKTSTFPDVRIGDDIIGSKIVQKKLWAALFPDRQSLVYLKKYLAEVEVRQNVDSDGSFPRRFLFNQTIYTYYYRYPSSDSNNVNPESACQLEIVLLHRDPMPVDAPVDGESSFFYYFVLMNGKMKLIKINLAG